MERAPLLDEPYFVTYRSMPRNERREISNKENIILIFPDNYPIEQRTQVVYKLGKSGYMPISLRFILSGVSYLALNEHKTIPFPMYQSAKDLEGLSKKARSNVMGQQTGYINDLISRIRVQKDKVHSLVRLYVTNNEGQEVDITEEARNFIIGTNGDIEKHYANRICFGHAMEELKRFVENNRGVLAIFDSPWLSRYGPSVRIRTSDTERVYSQELTDEVVVRNTEISGCSGVLRLIVRYGELEARRKVIQGAIDEGNIKLIPTFKKDRWPSHPLITRIKALALPIIADEVKKAGIFCDEQDIRFQTLFRLTTIPLDKLFYQGDELHKALLHQGSYYSWDEIPKINDVLLEQFQLQEDIVRAVIQEQLAIIRTRLKSSNLPLNEILVPVGIFREKDWKVMKEGGDTYAFNEKTKERIPVKFGPVDNDLAKSFHRDLHYIHAPRCDISLGLFLEDQNLPFSVLSIQKTDRAYKQNVLLALGFDPKYCVDFTRLYNWPGAPFNTSSTIFGCAFQYLEENYPETQAALSAFMPSYTSGLSMISGGFDIPVMVKDSKQIFQSRLLDGKLGWEHLTSRRRDENVPTIESVLPLLPTIEMLRPIKNPRFEPLLGTKGKMFVV